MALSGDLPSKLQLTARCPRSPTINADIPFDDLRECSEKFQRAFVDAWKVRKFIETLE